MIDEQIDNGEDERARWRFMSPRAIGDGKSVYLWRLRILVTPWFSIFLHRIYRPDNQRELHDHPWTFLSIILRGWYIENVPNPNWSPRIPYVGRDVKVFNWKLAEGRHSIRWLSRSPVWMLVFTGRRRRKWGFWVPAISRCACNPEQGTHEFGCIARWDPYREVFVEWDKYEKLNDA